MVTAGQRSITRLELEIWELSHNQFSQRITGLLWYRVYSPIRNQTSRNQIYYTILDQATEDTDVRRREAD
jgi:hypothetical protein